MMRYAREEVSSLARRVQGHSLFPDLDGFIYRVFRLATVTIKQMALDSTVSRAIFVVLSIYPPADSRTR
jgi:hypothetical protein